VRSTAAGTVARVHNTGDDNRGGKYVIINHGQAVDSKATVYTIYNHNSENSVKQGESVDVGTPIAKTGNTGIGSTGPHAHYGLRVTEASPFTNEFFKGPGAQDPAQLGAFLGVSEGGSSGGGNFGVSGQTFLSAGSQKGFLDQVVNSVKSFFSNDSSQGDDFVNTMTKYEQWRGQQK
jgi:murein DD-endopeptidase MepM/ murein hydrolase activator NlpD